MFNSVNPNMTSSLPAYETNPDRHQSSPANTSLSEQQQALLQGAVKVSLSEEAREMSLKLAEYDANSPLKRDESFFSREAVAQRKLESGASLASPVTIDPFDNEFQIQGVTYLFSDGTLEQFIAQGLDGKAKNASLIAAELGQMIRGTIHNPEVTLEERAINRETALKHAAYIAQNHFDDPEEARDFLNEISRFAENDILREKGYVVIDNSGLPPVPSYQSSVRSDGGVSLDAYAKQYGLASAHDLFTGKQTFNAFYLSLTRHGNQWREEIVQRFAENEKMVADMISMTKNNLNGADVKSSLQRLLKAF